jgi:hypothetical protein
MLRGSEVSLQIIHFHWKYEQINIFQACTKYQEQHFGLKPYSKYTRDLYNAILGSGSEVGDCRIERLKIGERAGKPV